MTATAVNYAKTPVSYTHLDVYKRQGCTLDYDQAWKLLVSVRLAAQCTDARVNVVVEELYAKYPDVASLAAAEPEEIEEIVRPCGLGRSKARDISACMRILHEQYDDKMCIRDSPYSIPYYRRKGWEIISDKISYEIKDYQLPKNHQVPGDVRRVDTEGEELKETYKRYAMRTHGAILRDDLAWNCLLYTSRCV